MILLNWGLMVGYNLAPNPGYLNATNASSVALLTLLSTWIFKDDLTRRKLVWVIGVMVGIVILFVF